MNAFDSRDFDHPEFLVQVISRGSFVDTPGGRPPQRYLIHTWTLRLNWYALNSYYDGMSRNPPECYETEAEYQEYKAEKDAKQAAWERQLLEAIGLGSVEKGYSIGQIVSEIFGVTYMEKI